MYSNNRTITLTEYINVHVRTHVLSAGRINLSTHKRADVR